MPHFNPSDLNTAARANLATHATWAQQRTPGMYAEVSDSLAMGDCGLSCDTFNMVCAASFTPETAPNRIQTVIDYYAGVNRPFSWWFSPGDHPSDLDQCLLDAGLHPAETELFMAADLQRLKAGDVSPAGLHIRRVDTAAGLRDFAAIVAANWTPPDANVLRFYESTAPVLLSSDSPLWFYVGYLDHVPVASAELTVAGGVVGLYSICTLENVRRRGFGNALTLQPLLDARAQGHHTAILQASDAGSRIYARVGFQTFGHITEYKPV